MTLEDRWKRIQAHVGAKADGNPNGANTVSHLEVALGLEKAIIEQVSNSPFPRDTESALRAFYGPPGDSKLVKIQFPYPMRLSWDKSVTVKSSWCHAKVKESLEAILSGILKHYGSVDAVSDARMDLFGGIYNFRKMRGGDSWSRHAWGIAIDLDPDQNGLNTPWPSKATMPKEVISIFEANGWKSYARSIGRDAMHFQATS